MPSAPTGPLNMGAPHRILRTRRPLTYTVSVDCIPPCQPGLKFPPHAVRLASPQAGSCGQRADSLSATAFTRYLWRTLAFSQKEHRGDPTRKLG